MSFIAGYLLGLEESGSSANLIEKTAYVNGVYLPSDDNADGYSKFIVEVPIDPINITANGTYIHPSGGGYSPINVDVPGTPIPIRDINTVLPEVEDTPVEVIDRDANISWKLTTYEFVDAQGYVARVPTVTVTSYNSDPPLTTTISGRVWATDNVDFSFTATEIEKRSNGIAIHYRFYKWGERTDEVFIPQQPFDGHPEIVWTGEKWVIRS